MLILVSLLASAIVKSSGIPKMTIYKAESNLGWLLIIPLFFTSLIFVVPKKSSITEIYGIMNLFSCSAYGYFRLITQIVKRAIITVELLRINREYL